METLETYTSTGIKLLHHPDVVSYYKGTKKAIPVSLQIAPTSRCNLNCVFCSNANRNSHEDLDMSPLVKVMLELKGRGMKTVEWTGGGDPTLWENINEGICYADGLGLEQGFISNGILVNDKLTRQVLDKLKWIRISMNCLDYVDSVDVPKIRGTVGFSYVWNERTDEDIIQRLTYHTRKYKPRYVRIVPNCQASHEEQERNNLVLGERVGEWGFPYFYQAKNFSAPRHCYWAYFKPFILHDGWVYPCSSVVLNTTSEKTFHDKFRWVKMENLPYVYDERVSPIIVSHCDHCVFKPQNDLIAELSAPNDMINFI